MDDEACDSCAITIKEIYDQYGTCAGKLHDLIRHINNSQGF